MGINATTLSPSNTFTTPKYRATSTYTTGKYKTGNYGTSKYKGTYGTGKYKSGTKYATAHFKSEDTFVNLLGDKNSVVDLKDRHYISDNNNTPGYPLGFYNVKSIENVTVNLGPNQSGNFDKGDSIFFDTGKLGSKTALSINNSTFITGDAANSPTDDDKDLIVFGTKGSGGKFKTSNFGLMGVDPDTSGQININGVSVVTGNDDDTVVFASANKASTISNTSVDVGQGKDYVYFNYTQSIQNGNVVNLGSDSDKDTIVFAGKASNSKDLSTLFSGLTGSNTIQIKNFVYGTDTLLVAGKAYSTQADINNSGFASKISFT